MQRWHRDRAHAERQQGLHRANGEAEDEQRWNGSHPNEAPRPRCECDFQIGRFRKSKGRGCRRTRCGLCKHHKWCVPELTRACRQRNAKCRDEIEGVSVVVPHKPRISWFKTHV